MTFALAASTADSADEPPGDHLTTSARTARPEPRPGCLSPHSLSLSRRLACWLPRLPASPPLASSASFRGCRASVAKGQGCPLLVETSALTINHRRVVSKETQ